MLRPSERARLQVLAGTALPGGRLLPAAGPSTVDRVEALLERLPNGLGRSYAALLYGLDACAVVMRGRTFDRLSLPERLAFLDNCEHGDGTRLLLRALLTPLKLAYFDDPAVYAALGCRYAVETPKSLERARWRDQILDAASLAPGDALECDVVVVGTGAGGAPIAAELARRGHAVLMLEEGEHVTRVDFNGRAVEMMRKMYRAGGATVALGNTAIPIPLGRAVGGTTLINSGTCFRVPGDVLSSWRQLGLGEFTRDALTPYYEEVEALMSVGPSSPAALGRPAELIARGCDALGYSHHALQRNAPGCDGQGLCCFGCPTDAKRSTNLSFVPRALERGAQLVTGFEVTEVLVEGETAVGVAGRVAGRRVSVRARAVVLACGAISTPSLLLRTGLANGSGQVGKNLSIHPATAALGIYPDRVNPTQSVPQGYAIDEFKRDGLYFEGGMTPLDVTAATLTGHGPRYVEMMEQFDRAFIFGFMVKDSSRGRVLRSRGALPAITYVVGDADLANVRRGLGILSRVYFASGAEEVVLPVVGHGRLRSLEDVERLERSPLKARHVDLSAYHPLGTARMGIDPLRSVVDATHETHDVHGLFICDGAAVPSALGVNPQLTIMAMSLRAAEFVHRRLARPPRATARPRP